MRQSNLAARHGPASLLLRGSFPIIVALAALLSGAAARAEEAACREFAWPLARELSWLSDPKLEIVETGATLQTNRAFTVRLKPMAEVSFTIQPERAPKIADSFGAVVKVDAGKAGLTQISLSDEAWIDVVQDGARLKSAAFSGKLGCLGMRKSVRFNLSASSFVIQISGAAAQTLNIAIAPATEPAN